MKITSKRLSVPAVTFAIALGAGVGIAPAASAVDFNQVVTASSVKTDSAVDLMWHVYLGKSCNTKAGAAKLVNKAKAKGFKAFAKFTGDDGRYGGDCYVAQIGAFGSKANAAAFVKKAKAAGLSGVTMAYWG